MSTFRRAAAAGSGSLSSSSASGPGGGGSLLTRKPSSILSRAGKPRLDQEGRRPRLQISTGGTSRSSASGQSLGSGVGGGDTGSSRRTPVSPASSKQEISNAARVSLEIKSSGSSGRPPLGSILQRQGSLAQVMAPGSGEGKGPPALARKPSSGTLSGLGSWSAEQQQQQHGSHGSGTMAVVDAGGPPPLQRKKSQAGFGFVPKGMLEAEMEREREAEKGRRGAISVVGKSTESQPAFLTKNMLDELNQKSSDNLSGGVGMRHRPRSGSQNENSSTSQSMASFTRAGQGENQGRRRRRGEKRALDPDKFLTEFRSECSIVRKSIETRLHDLEDADGNVQDSLTKLKDLEDQCASIMSKLSQFEEDRKSKENALRGITVDEILQLTRAGKTPPSPAPPNESVDRSSDRDGDGDGAGAKRQAGRTGALEVGVTVAAEEEEEEEEELLSPVSP